MISSLRSLKPTSKAGMVFSHSRIIYLGTAVLEIGLLIVVASLIQQLATIIIILSIPLIATTLLRSRKTIVNGEGIIVSRYGRRTHYPWETTSGLQINRRGRVLLFFYPHRNAENPTTDNNVPVKSVLLPAVTIHDLPDVALASHGHIDVGFNP